jgi:uncharacterized membrane protein YdjX (TVP38/TMEM64 family)
MRLFLIFLGLTALFLIPWLFLSERLEERFGGEAGVAWLRSYGSLAGFVGVGLLVADLLLPVPSTPVMAALGLIYGPLSGGAFSACGLFLAGTTAYAATRLLGKKAALFLVGERDLAKAHDFFEGAGGFAVASSRVLPLLAEVISCLAGLAAMSPRRFFVALACGSIVSGFVFATIGASTHPMVGIVASFFAPLLMWPVANRLLKKRPEAPQD